MNEFERCQNSVSGVVKDLARYFGGVSQWFIIEYIARSEPTDEEIIEYVVRFLVSMGLCSHDASRGPWGSLICDAIRSVCSGSSRYLVAGMGVVVTIIAMAICP